MTLRRVTIGRTSDVTVLNPLLYSDLGTGEVLNRIFDHLVLTDERLRYVPGRLTRNWSVSESGLVWDFELRPEARWHDETPVTAQDAAFTFTALQNSASGSHRWMEFMVDGEPIAFEALDAHRLRVRLPRPYPALLNALAWRPVLPRHRYADAPLDGHPLNGSPVGSGAFEFARWHRGDRVVMRARTGYHLGRPPLDEVVWRCLPSAESAVEALIAGEVDYVPGVRPALADELARSGDLRVNASVDAGFTYLGFHLDNPLFADVRLRRAIAHAIDRERLVRDVLDGHGEVAHSMITPLSPWHNADVPRFAHDRRAAGELLDAAGYPPGPDGMRMSEDGRPLAFTLLTVAGDSVKENAAAAVAGDLADAGVDVTVRSHAMGELLRDHVYPRTYDAVLMALVPNPDPAFLHAFYHSAMLTPQGWNRLAYRNPQVDRLLDQSQTQPDRASRMALLNEAQALIVGDVPQVFLFHPMVTDVARRRIKIPQPPRTPGNRFMYLHRWDVTC
ncbi:ABC transporter substrate-binding protein [Actinomadura sp. 3N407]|uniref:ABC transporter substrate-binding protein n=1 Tax=Actinomadura sp. 3N407 TaxID=3457423 RepID=UPI003FCE4C6E